MTGASARRRRGIAHGQRLIDRFMVRQTASAAAAPPEPRRRGGAATIPRTSRSSSGSRHSSSPPYDDDAGRDAGQRAAAAPRLDVDQRERTSEHRGAHAERRPGTRRRSRGRRPSARRRARAPRARSGTARPAWSRARSATATPTTPQFRPTTNAIRWPRTARSRSGRSSRAAAARHQDVDVQALQRLHDADPREDLDDRDGRVPLVAEHERHEVRRDDHQAGERGHGDGGEDAG